MSSAPSRALALTPIVVGVISFVLGGCGGSQPDRGTDRARSDRATGQALVAGATPPSPAAGARATVRAFARAVRSGRTARMCRLLRDQARRAQGCGREREDFGPSLRFTIRREPDVRLVSASGGEATAAFPRLARDAHRRPAASWCRPQLMRLQRHGEWWFVVELRYGSDFEPVVAGCHGLTDAVSDAEQALPTFNAAEGECPTADAAALDRGWRDRAGRAALLQAPVLSPATDLAGMRVSRVTLAPEEDPGRGAYARVKCGRAVLRRTAVVSLSFPSQRPSASRSQGVVLVSRFGERYRVWAVLH